MCFSSLILTVDNITRIGLFKIVHSSQLNQLTNITLNIVHHCSPVLMARGSRRTCFASTADQEKLTKATRDLEEERQKVRPMASTMIKVNPGSINHGLLTVGVASK